MDLLKQRILRDASVMNDAVLKLDDIFNHQVDPQLMVEIGKQFAVLFADSGITKIVTIESSGIPIAFATALALNVPLVFARRKKTLITDPDSWSERVPSFTKGIVTNIMVSRKMLSESDRVLFIDDMIANGDVARGLIRIVAQSGATLAGVGIAIEKSFQNGGRSIREQGIRVESLVRVSSLDGGEIHFEE